MNNEERINSAKSNLEKLIDPLGETPLHVIVDAQNLLERYK